MIVQECFLLQFYRDMLIYIYHVVKVYNTENTINSEILHGIPLQKMLLYSSGDARIPRQSEILVSVFPTLLSSQYNILRYILCMEINIYKQINNPSSFIPSE